MKESTAEVSLAQPEASVAPLKLQRFARRSAQKEQQILSSFLDKGVDREDLIFLKLAYNLLDESVIPSKLAIYLKEEIFSFNLTNFCLNVKLITKCINFPKYQLLFST